MRVRWNDQSKKALRKAASYIRKEYGDMSGTLAVSLKTKPNKPNPTTTKQTKSSRRQAAFFVPLREKNSFPLTGKEIVFIFAPEK